MSDATRQIQGAMAEVVDKAIQGTSEIALTQNSAWQNTNALVLRTQDKLEMLSNNQIAQLMGAVGYVNQALVSSVRIPKEMRGLLTETRSIRLKWQRSTMRTLSCLPRSVACLLPARAMD